MIHHLTRSLAMKNFLLLLFAVYSSAVLGQGLSALSDVRKVTDEAMTRIANGDFDGSFKILKPLTIVPSAEFDAMVGQTKLQLPIVGGRFGSSIGYEFIREDRLGETLARFTYIHRFEKHAMRWLFYLYRGNNGWVVNTFLFDDKWHELFR